MRLIRLAPIAILVVGCTSQFPDAPTVAEPAADAVSDRALIRVRMSPPVDDYSPTITDDTQSACANGGHAVCGGHAGWRLDGGAIVDVDHPATSTRDGRVDVPFLFAATLTPGVDHLDIGRCDSFDYCGWTPRTITLTTRSGSPDPALAGTGQLLLPTIPLAYGVTSLADGRLLINTGASGLVALRSDGTPDLAFGDAGAITSAGAASVFPQSDGKLVVVVPTFGDPQIARYGGDGKPDPTFGTTGSVALATPTSRNLYFAAVAADPSGGTLIAGQTDLAERFIMGVGADGARTSYASLTTAALSYTGAALDADGTLALLTSDRVRLETSAGLDPTFGVAGTVMLPDAAARGAGAIRFVDHDLVLVQPVASRLRVTFISRAGVIGSSIDLPFGSDIPHPTSMTVAPDGALYVIGALAHPKEATARVDDLTAGDDFGVVRIRAGALDTTFGDQGLAHASFMLAWDPIAIDTIADTPIAIAIGADGAPWVVGRSQSIIEPDRAWLHTVGPTTALVRFMP